MIDWLSENSEAVNVVISIAMLFVWIAYLQVFVSSYRRQRQATILVSAGGGSGLDARCLISNMSQGAVYVRSLILEIETAEGKSSRSVTELEDLEEWSSPSDLNLWTRQGPLAPGSLRDMGQFRALLNHALQTQGRPARRTSISNIEAIQQVRVTVIANYGPENLLVAAEQSYTLTPRDGAVWLSPQTITTRQIRSRRERAGLRTRLEEEVLPGTAS